VTPNFGSALRRKVGLGIFSPSLKIAASFNPKSIPTIRGLTGNGLIASCCKRSGTSRRVSQAPQLLFEMTTVTRLIKAHKQWADSIAYQPPDH